MQKTQSTTQLFGICFINIFEIFWALTVFPILLRTVITTVTYPLHKTPSMQTLT